jgi:oxygen-independent coproporphyrinogen-3 oxidase
MNRVHTAEESVNSVKAAQDAGINNITIDLIYGSKFQDPATWKRTLDQAIQLNVQHISSYNLTIEQKTLLGVNNSKGREPNVDETLSSELFTVMQHVLTDAGFIQYEISNFGKPGFYARHNSNYWLQGHYLGLGPSAHSFNGVSRQWNVRNNSQYLAAVNAGKPFFEKEELSLENRYNEYILTRLRTIWGCDLRDIENIFGVRIAEHFKAGVYQRRQHFSESNGVYTLTNAAKLLADGIASDLFI